MAISQDKARTPAKAEAHTVIGRVRAGGAKPPFPVEYAGWLPCFRFFGDCGNHPQFKHTQAPPPGYRFVVSAPNPAEEAEPVRRRGVAALVGKAFRAAWLAVRPLCSVVRQACCVSPSQSLRTLAAAIRLFLYLRRAGCRFWPTIQFLRTRHFRSQVLVPPDAKLLFLTSVPYTFGQRPWVIEIEDATTLFYPHHMNGRTARTPIRRSPFLPILKALLEHPNCRGIVTHMRSTAENLPKLLDSEAVAAKTTYVPFGVALPPAPADQAPAKHLDLLFTCGWFQNPDSFFLRGGLDVVRAFEIVHERYPHVRLTLRTGLPPMPSRFRGVIEKCWVRVIDRLLSDEEMDELMGAAHVFLIPAARIHVVSVLRAMAHGQAVVASDGWGFREYVEHGCNGLIVPGRSGRASWMDEEAGMLRENYYGMFSSGTDYSRRLADAIGLLVEDHALRRRLGEQARRDVETRYSLENWNRGLKEALDRAVGRRP